MPTSRKYYEQNKERISQYNKQKYLEKREALLAYQREYRQRNKERIYKRDKLKRQERLSKAIELLGGKCSRCLQSYDAVCYDFHHTDPAQKDFTIGENMLVGEERFFTEVSKCVLLCANCHRITHKELRNDR